MKQYRYVYEEGKLPAAFGDIPFVMSLPAKYLKHVLASSRIREYDPGETLITEGETDPWVYMLLSGKLSVRKDGESVTVLDSVGEVIGELAAVGTGKRSASVVAESKVICLAVDWSFVDTLDEKEKHACCLVIYRLFVNILSERVKKTTQQLARVENELKELRRRTSSRG